MRKNWQVWAGVGVALGAVLTIGATLYDPFLT